MHGIVTRYAYIPAGTSSGYGKPTGKTMAGGNGRWVAKTPVRVLVEVKDDNGRLHTVDIISALRKKCRLMSGTKKSVTKTMALDTCERLIKIGDVEISEDGKEITNLFDLI